MTVLSNFFENKYYKSALAVVWLACSPRGYEL